MLRWSVRLAIILPVLLLCLFTAHRSEAAGSFGVDQAMPAAGATNVPVNLLNASYKPSGYGYANQSISLSLTGLPASDCKPKASSFTLNTVKLISSNPSDDQVYALTSPVFGKSSSGWWLALSSAVNGFELLPFTGYTLQLVGGNTGIDIVCSGTDYFLSGWSNVSFTTGSDTVAPEIMGPQAQVTSTTATLSWETFQAAGGSVGYGISNTGATVSQPGFGKLHRITIANLIPGTTYDYQIRSTDAAGNTGTSNGQFTTVGVSNVVVRDITDMAATITWTTNQATDSLVEIGTDSSYGNRQGNGGQLTSHSLRLVGLRPSTAYHFRIVSSNSAGSSTFNDNQFSTLAATSVAGQTDTQDISASEDNIKLFPQVPFVEPLVLGASTAAEAVSGGFTLGKNLLTGQAIQGWPQWAIWALWILPLLLIAGILVAWWRLRHHQKQTQQLSA